MTSKTGIPTCWQRNFRAVWFAELMATSGFMIVNPILPLYVRELGTLTDQQVRIWAGLVFFVHGLTMSIFGPMWGALSDRYGRKVMFERAMFSGSALMAMMGLVQNVHQLALLRALQGALSGTVAAAATLVAAIVPRQRSGYALGMLQVAIYFGMSAGPVLGGGLADAFGYQAAFWFTGGLLFAAVLVVAVFVEEPSQTTKPAKVEQTAPKNDRSRRCRLWNCPTLVLELAPLLSVLGTSLLTQLAAQMLLPTLPLFIEMVAPPGAPVASITGLVGGVSGLAGALGSLGLGKLGDRAGHRTILKACAVGSVVFYTAQFFIRHYLWLLPLQAAAGLATGGALVAMRASLVALAPEGREGIIYGVDGSVTSIAFAFGPMIGSALAAWESLRVPFLAAAGMSTLASIASFYVPATSKGSVPTETW
jgi:DHA1 family multidrug resistance protein-like MFS transporter